MFEKLGLQIKEAIKNCQYLDDEFPDIAVKILEDFKPPEILNTENIVNKILKEPQSIWQTRSGNGFGEPPMVVFASEEFYIEVLFWFPSRTNIHGHGFCGAFKVLQGTSLHTEYEYKITEIWDDNSRVGDLSLEKIELLEPNQTKKIFSREGFIHSVAHLGQPSLTLVVRTRQLEKMRGSQQYQYFRSGLSFKKHRQQEQIRRQLQALFVLKKISSTRFDTELMDYVKKSDASRLLNVLLYCQQHIKKEAWDQNYQTMLLSYVLEDRADVIKATLEEKRKTDSIWRNITLFPKTEYLQIALNELIGTQVVQQEYLKIFYPQRKVEFLINDWQNKVLQNL